MHFAPTHGISPFSLITQSVKAFIRDDMTTYATALAYHILLSLFPFLIFLIALLSFFDLSDFYDWIRQQIQPLLPPPAMEQVDAVIQELQMPQKGLISAGAATALWLASRGIRALMNAMNVAYGAKESRPVWKLYPLSVLYTLGIALMLVIASGLLIMGPQAMQWLAQQVGLEQLFVLFWTWLRWPAALLLLMLAVAMLYQFAPNVRHPFRLVSTGSVLSVLVWVAASLGFAYYVQNFADYSVTYGSIGTVIVLLIYLYISSAALLFGAEVNAVIEGFRKNQEANRQST